MAEQKTGEVDWGDTAPAFPKNNRRPSRFLSMKEPGDYKIRIISKPFQAYTHWIEVADAQGIKRNKRVNCSLDNCPICAETAKGPKAGWLLRVIYRNPNTKANEALILDCGSQIFNGIKKYTQNPDWGKISTYDVTITKGPKGSNPLYSVAPSPKTPLTEAETELAKAVSTPGHDDFLDLEKFTQPWTVQEIEAVVNGEQPKSREVQAEAKASLTSDDDPNEFDTSTDNASTDATVETATVGDDDFLDLD